jgi:hypothetical protein
MQRWGRGECPESTPRHDFRSFLGRERSFALGQPFCPTTGGRIGAGWSVSNADYTVRHLVHAARTGSNAACRPAGVLRLGSKVVPGVAGGATMASCIGFPSGSSGLSPSRATRSNSSIRRIPSTRRACRSTRVITAWLRRFRLTACARPRFTTARSSLWNRRSCVAPGRGFTSRFELRAQLMRGTRPRFATTSRARR